MDPHDPPDGAAEDVGVLEPAVVLGQLHELRHGVRLEDQRELVTRLQGTAVDS